MSLKIGGGELQSFHLVVLYSSVGKEISQLVYALLMINSVGHITMYSLLNSRIFVCILFFPLQLNPGKQQISYKPFFFFLVCTVSYGASYFLLGFMAGTLCAWAINPIRKNWSITFGADFKLS